MKRYFYSGNAITKRILDGQFNMVRGEDQIFRDALLAALNMEPTKINTFHQLRQTLLNMAIQQQQQYANNYHIQSLFKHLDILHRTTRGKSMIIKGRQSFVKDIVDPDKFPIWDLKKRADVFYSIWNTLMGRIRYDMGHQLVVRSSLIQHPEGGRGVFVELAKNKKEIKIGDFLGLVPGSIYESYENYNKIRLMNLKSYERVPEHLHFASGKVLQLGQLGNFKYANTDQTHIEPYMVNPYSLGQFINHPPYGQKPNVIFTQIQFKSNFFPAHFKKYMPYSTYLPVQVKKKDEKITVVGIFARQPIKNKQQLYVDYCQNHIYPIDKIPEWLTQPDYSTQKSKFEQQADAYNLNLKKEQYEYPSPLFWRLLQKQALKQKQHLYEQYLKSITYRPKKVLFEEDDFTIRSMNSQKVDQGGNGSKAH